MGETITIGRNEWIVLDWRQNSIQDWNESNLYMQGESGISEYEEQTERLCDLLWFGQGLRLHALQA